MNLPEPSLPEHQLIRSAAPSPVLSTGLKARVMSQCESQIRVARLKFRAKVAVSTLVACGVLFLLLPGEDPGADAQGPGITAADSQPDVPSSRTSDYGPHDGSSDLAIDRAVPDRRDDALPIPQDMQQINRMIEERLRRDRMLECALLPFL